MSKLTKWQKEIVEYEGTISLHTLINFTLDAASDFFDDQQQRGQLNRRFWKYQYLTDRLHTRVSELQKKAYPDEKSNEKEV